MLERTVQIKHPGPQKKRELEGMNSEELHVNWRTQPPLAGLGARGLGKAEASRQSERTRELPPVK